MPKLKGSNPFFGTKLKALGFQHKPRIKQGLWLRKLLQEFPGWRFRLAGRDEPARLDAAGHHERVQTRF